MKKKLFNTLWFALVFAAAGCSTSTPDAPEKKPVFFNTFKAHRFYRGSLNTAFNTAKIKAFEAAYTKAGFRFLALPGQSTKSVVPILPVGQGPNKGTFCEPPFALRSAQVRASTPLVEDNVDALDIGDFATAEPFEDVWDSYLSTKHRVFAFVGDGGKSLKNVNSGWVAAWLKSSDDQPTAQNICAALSEGNFYFSRGPKFASIVVTKNTLEVSVDGFNPATDQIDFIGLHGKLLNRANAASVRYVLLGGEGYVRVHVRQGRGEARRDAWTQSYFVKYE